MGSVGPQNSPGLNALGRTLSDSLDQREINNLREDLQAVKDEATASKEVIGVLRKQVEELQMEKETL